MKLSSALLLLSVGANGVLLAAFVFKPNLAPPSLRTYLGSTQSERSETNGAVEAAEAPARRPSPSAPPAIQRSGTASLWAALESDDLATLVGRLRAAGFTRTAIRSIVNARLEERFAARFREITGPYEDIPFWKPDPMSGFSGMSFYEQYNLIHRERTRMLRELLGTDAHYGSDPTAAQQRQYGSLSQAKIDLVQRIADDYAEMTSQIRAGMQGLTLPEDREKLALLEREKQADLAAILSPAELEDYQMRSSPVTMRLRGAMTLMDATEAEFRAIFQVQQRFHEQINPGPGLFNSDTMNQRREAQQQQAEQLKAVLGESRYSEFARASNSEYQQLHRIAQRDNVPLDATVRAFSLRDEVAKESTRIMSDRSLDLEAKRTALRVLGQNTKTRMLGTLGPTAGAAYAQSARWLAHVENGGAISIDSSGNASYRTLPSPRK